MKTFVALLLAAGMIAAAAAQPAAPAPTEKKAAPRIELEPASKPGAAKDPKKDAKKDTKKKEEEMGKIDGMEIARPENRFMGLQLIDGKFKLTFYNAKKKPVAPDVARVVLRWDPKYKLGLERTVLTASGAHALASEKFVRPPYNFKLTLVLLRDPAAASEPAGEVEPVGETYVVDFRQ